MVTFTTQEPCQHRGAGKVAQCFPHDSRRENILCVKQRLKVHPDMNFALLCQMLHGTGVTQAPPWREEKSSKLHWEGHPVASTPIVWKFSKVIMAEVQKNKSEVTDNLKCLFMFPHMEVTREMRLNHNSATNDLLEIRLFCFSCIWNAYSKESYCVLVFFHLHVNIL